MQTYHQNVAQATTNSPNNNHMASFVARLMSLNSHELQCLHADSELMRRLSETQLLMESRLQHLNLQNKLHALQQQHLHQHHQQQQQQQFVQTNNQNAFYGAHQDYYAQLTSQLQQQQQQLAYSASQLALDLRTSPQHQQPAVSLLQQHQLQQQQQQQHFRQRSGSSSDEHRLGCFNPKKLKLSEYNNTTSNSELQRQHTNANIDSIINNNTNTSANQAPKSNQQQHTPNEHQQTTITATTTTLTTTHKKYKGEFDEPNPLEVEQRQRMLARSDNYHKSSSLLGRCACVLGSEFRDNKSVSEVLAMINRWQSMDTADRIRAKWDISDLPKDIPLSDIKKFEDLRREASNGRADFGGASKRKPLGIRGTRQFLLILYCLWGHPGRDDVMQKEGYCPHCFAKIKKANEQSTLVRVVNHFNMKHRRGANPRLSPHRDTSPPSVATTPTTTMMTMFATIPAPTTTTMPTPSAANQKQADVVSPAPANALTLNTVTVTATTTTDTTAVLLNSCGDDGGTNSATSSGHPTPASSPTLCNTSSASSPSSSSLLSPSAAGSPQTPTTTTATTTAFGARAAPIPDS